MDVRRVLTSEKGIIPQSYFSHTNPKNPKKERIPNSSRIPGKTPISTKTKSPLLE